MKKQIILITIALISVFILMSGSAVAGRPIVYIAALQTNWTLGVYSLYCGPPDYDWVSPGLTAEYLGREAGIIKAGLTPDPDDLNYWDDGLFAFKPMMTIEEFAENPLTYDVVNQYGVNPVWMTIEIDTGTLGDRTDNTTFQMVPAPYGSADYVTVNAAEGVWYRWVNNMGDTDPYAWSLAEIASHNSYENLPVVRTYLRLGIGNSYGPAPFGTQAWVDKASIGGLTYDFIVRGKGYAEKDWGTNPGWHGFKTP